MDNQMAAQKTGAASQPRKRASTKPAQGADKPARKVASKTAAPKKTKAPERPVGRPTDYSEEVAASLCAQIAMGLSVRTICKAEDMPAMTTFFMWLRRHPEFVKQYEAAKAESASALAEELLDIADDGTNDWMEIHDKEGACVGYKVNGEHVQRSRLRLDTRKWLLSKLAPKKFGDKVDLNLGGQEGNPLKVLHEQIKGNVLGPVKS
jgi:hypothetical protein